MGVRGLMHIDMAILKNLERWIEEQKMILKAIKDREKELEGADRLSLVLNSRIACHHVSKTIKSFDNWLQDSFIISSMPPEMLASIQKTLWGIMCQLIEFDVKHTSEYREYLQKAIKEGKLPQLLWIEKPERRPPYTM